MVVFILDVEKYTEKYHQLLTTSGESGREIREMTRDNARMSAEIEHLKKSVEDGRMNLEKVNDEKLLLEFAMKEKTEELNKIESVLKITIEEQKSKNNSGSKILNSKMVEEVEHLKKTNDDMKRNIQKLTDDKLMLTTVIKENNEELKEMEKLLTEKRTECEEQRMQNNTGKLESLDLMCKEQDATITDLKNKIRVSMKYSPINKGWFQVLLSAEDGLWYLLILKSVHEINQILIKKYRL